ncbi:MAG TPA: aspartate kinase, partial [Thermoanaerobaculia bacterium]|nr:aspartate kinase [Thermoanaerobaculia bacterium]
MKPRVLKFGGTSVGSAEAMARVVSIIARASAQGPPVVVASALSRVTDELKAALFEARAGRLDVSRFVNSLGSRHLAQLATLASGQPAERGERALAAELAVLEA